MSQKPNYREQIDACRPGSSDLSLPALAELAQAADTDRAIADELARSQRFDRAVSTALHDVPLPAGLLERLEARLAEAGDAEPVESTGEVALPPPPVRFTPRGILAAALSIAALAFIALSAMFWPQPGRQVSSAELAELSSAWFDQKLAQNVWNPVRSAPPTFPVPGGVSGANGWQPFATPAGEKGVVYDLTRGLRPRARLFVIATPHDYQVGTLPTRLRDATGNVAVAAWQQGRLLFVVVVVQENGQMLDHFVRPPNVAFAPACTAAPPA